MNREQTIARLESALQRIQDLRHANDLMAAYVEATSRIEALIAELRQEVETEREAA